MKKTSELIQQNTSLKMYSYLHQNSLTSLIYKNVQVNECDDSNDLDRKNERRFKKTGLKYYRVPELTKKTQNSPFFIQNNYNDPYYQLMVKMFMQKKNSEYPDNLSYEPNSKVG